MAKQPEGIWQEGIVDINIEPARWASYKIGKDEKYFLPTFMDNLEIIVEDN